RSATLTVNPAPAAATLSSVSLNPTSVTGGNTSPGTVTLSGPAPSGGLLGAPSSKKARGGGPPGAWDGAAGARTPATPRHPPAGASRREGPGPRGRSFGDAPEQQGGGGEPAGVWDGAGRRPLRDLRGDHHGGDRERARAPARLGRRGEPVGHLDGDSATRRH